MTIRAAIYALYKMRLYVRLYISVRMYVHRLLCYFANFFIGKVTQLSTFVKSGFDQVSLSRGNATLII